MVPHDGRAINVPKIDECYTQDDSPQLFSSRVFTFSRLSVLNYAPPGDMSLND